MTVLLDDGPLPANDAEPRFFRVLGTPVSIVSPERVLSTFERWLMDRRDRYVVLRDVHGVVRARNDAKLQKAHEAADLVAPDGMPLVWAAHLAGIQDVERVCGPDLLPATCQHGLSRQWRHYFFGGTPEVTEQLISNLMARYEGISIIGHRCPPFRSLTEEETEIECAAIRFAQADFVWVGLGTPKQDVWMHENRGRCGGAILLGVGAAFDVHAGAIERAPCWMQRSGLEWLFRLSHDPRRLWKRYVILAPIFAVLALFELVTGRINALPASRRPAA